MQNQEADDLTNEEFRHFDPAKRIPVRLEDLDFSLMNSLFAAGDDYLKELEQQRAAEKRKLEKKIAAGGSRATGKRKKQGGLKETDPW